MIKGSSNGKAQKGTGGRTMKDSNTLSHVKWDCKYHIVLITQYRHRKIYKDLREKIGRIIRNLCEQKRH